MRSPGSSGMENMRFLYLSMRVGGRTATIDPNSIAVQSGVDLILHLLYRAERLRYAGETMLVGIHHQFQAVGHLKLVEDRSQMMAYGRFRNEQPFADLFVSQ